MSEINAEWILKESRSHGDTIHIDLWYPDRDGEPSSNRINKISVGLVDVRSADDIRISYDFNRDGWKIEQASVFEGDTDDFDPDWQEVAFIKAWARENSK